MMRLALLFWGLWVFSCRLNTERNAVEIPAAAYETLQYVQKYNRAPKGYVGGRRFGNYEKRLPGKTVGGARIIYREWDIYPKIPGRNRGAERLVTGSDQRAWYTADHYESFILMR